MSACSSCHRVKALLTYFFMLLGKNVMRESTVHHLTSEVICGVSQNDVNMIWNAQLIKLSQVPQFPEVCFHSTYKYISASANIMPPTFGSPCKFNFPPGAVTFTLPDLYISICCQASRRECMVLETVWCLGKVKSERLLCCIRNTYSPWTCRLEEQIVLNLKILPKRVRVPSQAGALSLLTAHYESSWFLMHWNYVFVHFERHLNRLVTPFDVQYLCHRVRHYSSNQQQVAILIRVWKDRLLRPLPWCRGACWEMTASKGKENMHFLQLYASSSFLKSWMILCPRLSHVVLTALRTQQKYLSNCV